MFSLSSITFVGEGTRELLNLQLSKQFNGNVLAFPIVPTIDERLLALVERNLAGALEGVPGITTRSTLGSYRITLTAVDGVEVQGGSFESDEFDDVNAFDRAQVAPFVWSAATIWESDSPTVYDNVAQIVAGRNLTAEDRGRQVLIGPADSAGLIGIEVGSQLTYQVFDQTMVFEVVGLYQIAGGLNGGGPIMPPDSLGEAPPFFQIYSYQVDREYVGQAVAELSAIRVPRTISLDVSFIDSLISRLINQFAAIPTVVGLLSLVAAAVIMANTVALSTLERQRQIGILKAIGLKSNRVLRIMLIESVLVGLLSALIGIGLSLIFLAIFSSFSGTILPMPRESQVVGIALIVAAVLIGALATFLSSNVAVRERVMNVLRYE
jgi:putative ABC transport system permease protein